MVIVSLLTGVVGHLPNGRTLWLVDGGYELHISDVNLWADANLRGWEIIILGDHLIK